MVEDILVYVRSSSDEQASSCRQQVLAIQEDLRAEGVLTEDEHLPDRHSPARGVYADEGWSGWKYDIDERPGSQTLLEYCRANRRPADNPGLIILWALSRLGRFPDGPEQAIHCLYEFRRLGWWVRSLTQEGLDSADGDRLMRVIRTALESDKDTSASEEKSKDVTRGKADAIVEGKWVGGTAPFGYERWACRLVDGKIIWIEPLPDGKRNGNQGDSFTLLREGTKARWLRQVFGWFADGEDGSRFSMSEVARRLIREGVAQGRGGEGWMHTAVAKILRNEVYISIQRTAEGEPHRALWEPLVDRELWDRAQARLNGEPVRGRAANSDFVLSGLVRCMACGAVLWGEKNKSGQGYRYYYRPKKDHTGTRSCESCRRRIPIEDLEVPVVEAISSVADHPVVIRAVDEEREILRGGDASFQKRTAEIDREIAELKRQMSALADLAVVGGTAADVVMQKLSTHNKTVERLSGEREKLEVSRRGAGCVTKFASASRGFHRVYGLASAAERKELVRAFVATIEVDGARGRVRLVYRRPA